MSRPELGLRNDAQPPVAGWLNATVVTVGSENWSGEDLVMAGVAAGIWEPMEAALLAGTAALRDWEPTPEAVGHEVRNFRYARKLISAREFEQWCAQREVTHAGIKRAAARRLARARATPGAGGSPEASLELIDELPAEAIFCGAVAASALWITDRILVLEETPGLTAPTAAIDGLLAREHALLAGSASCRAEAERRVLAGRVLAASAAYDSRVAALASDVALASVIRRRSLDWLEVELDEFECRTDGAAREVAALLREGIPVQQVAELAGIAPHDRSYRLVNAPEAIQGFLGSAAPGDTFGPFDEHGTSRIFRVRSRRSPRLEDSATRARAVDELVASEMARRRAGRIRWHERH